VCCGWNWGWSRTFTRFGDVTDNKFAALSFSLREADNEVSQPVRFFDTFASDVDVIIEMKPEGKVSSVLRLVKLWHVRVVTILPDIDAWSCLEGHGLLDTA
jgi:hypothetical protein